MKLTFISDTHNKHNQLRLIGGDVLIHSGDFSSRGYDHEVENFCKWFSKVPGYETKIFIAGNHDWGFQDSPSKMKKILSNFPHLIYLEDDFVYIGEYPNFVKVYGTPWQPEFCNWAFNLPRDGQELKERWDDIPLDTDILITHGPPKGVLDDNNGCKLLKNRIEIVKPKINVFGHIHNRFGFMSDKDTYYFNASVLDNNYIYTHTPMNVDWDPVTNIITFL